MKRNAQLGARSLRASFSETGAVPEQCEVRNDRRRGGRRDEDDRGAEPRHAADASSRRRTAMSPDRFAVSRAWNATAVNWQSPAARLRLLPDARSTTGRESGSESTKKEVRDDDL